MVTNQQINVDLGDRSYPITAAAGLLEEPDTYLSPFLKFGKVFVIVDNNVAKFHGSQLKAALSTTGLEQIWLEVPAGEASKCWAQYTRLCEALLTARVERTDTVVAFGGGVIGDLAGYVAATVLRGVNFIQIPTSLLAQVDSSVGGKTGINTAQGKNLVGAFYQPKAVLIDLSVLETLPRRELLAGYAEVVKYGLIRDYDFFEWLELKAKEMLAGDVDLLQEAIIRSCQTKADVVIADERESGVRGLLNLGHTFGHAFEAEMGYDGRLLHGEAVAIGTLLAAETSVRHGWLQRQEATRIQQHFESIELRADFTGFPGEHVTAEALLDHMTRDKKVANGKSTFVMLSEIGKAFLTKDVMPDEVKNLLSESLKRPK
jgi:3-dehydroquinate synthase